MGKLIITLTIRRGKMISQNKSKGILQQTVYLHYWELGVIEGTIDCFTIMQENKFQRKKKEAKFGTA